MIKNGFQREQLPALLWAADQHVGALVVADHINGRQVQPQAPRRVRNRSRPVETGGDWSKLVETDRNWSRLVENA